MKDFLRFVFDILKVVIVALIIVIPIRYFLFQPFFVKGQSMDPNFYDKDYLIIDEITYRFREPQRGEVIIFKYPFDPSERYIKRIIGLPGETVQIKEGKITIINNKEARMLDESEYFPSGIYTSGDLKVLLQKDEYFVLGDNRSVSYDSRRWGVLPRENIIGRAYFRVLPVTDFSKIEVPQYK